MVREAGFEPAPGCPDPLLRRACLPFRHSRTFDYTISVRCCPLVYEGKRRVTSQAPATQAVAHPHEDAAQTQGVFPFLTQNVLKRKPSRRMCDEAVSNQRMNKSHDASWEPCRGTFALPVAWTRTFRHRGLRPEPSGRVALDYRSRILTSRMPCSGGDFSYPHRSPAIQQIRFPCCSHMDHFIK